MDIEIFTLCDAAADYGGKLSLLGTFDRIHAAKFPAAHPHCAVALRIRFDRIEEGRHRVRINIVDEDGRPIAPSVDGTIEIRFPPGVSSLCANLVLNVNGMKFEKPGRYSIDLAVDSRHERSLPFTVFQIQQETPRPDQTS